MITLLQLVVVLVVLGLVWWLITTYLPLPAPIKMAITVIFVVIVCIYLLSVVGLVPLSFK